MDVLLVDVVVGGMQMPEKQEPALPFVWHPVPSTMTLPWKQLSEKHTPVA